MCKEWEEFRDKLEERFDELNQVRMDMFRGDLSYYSTFSNDDRDCIIRVEGELTSLQWVLEMMPSKELQCP